MDEKNKEFVFKNIEVKTSFMLQMKYEEETTNKQWKERRRDGGGADREW